MICGRVNITGSDVNYITNVLRLKKGSFISVYDGRGRACLARIDKINKDKIGCTVVEEFAAAPEPLIKITLVQGLPKGDKMETIIQKCTELGVSEVIPLSCERSIVKIVQENAAGKVSRWQRVALEASRQCRRSVVPKVSEPMGWREILNSMPEDALGLLFWEKEDKCSLKDCLRASNPESIYLFIGPEGGFTADEVEMTKEFGVISVSLGPRIMRTETTGPAVMAVIQYELGDLGGACD
ncbi:MAG: Ribosomal RNA small subunit methyltransferase E [Desulfofundulus kuznetsovii]|nr:MAG: Ribosomal RNA small subunit methyltransferase E [Desulfotomaculum sp. 46_80]KUK85401.1 MAG: Ribosomal RNA small subunit methyltransferase E [Desulfofundulus kuznetsovii]